MKIFIAVLGIAFASTLSALAVEPLNASVLLQAEDVYEKGGRGERPDPRCRFFPERCK